jgi:outer membrane protein OmpA-like peptidoglycan-associated protein
LKRIVLFLSLSALVMGGCAAPQTKTGQGATYGAAGGAVVGAILGQVLGKDTKSTLWGTAIGAAVGGAAGAGVGKMMDDQERDMRAALASSEAATIKREGDLLSLTFKSDVTFDVNSAIVKSGLYPELDRIAEVMRKYPRTLIRIEGHTDSTGSEEYNLDLSRRRSQAVGTLLEYRSINSSRLELIGYGEEVPVATNDTEAGRRMNRRVEIKIAPTPAN